jgi:multidrug transporter EmrE-like cation transporter
LTGVVLVVGPALDGLDPRGLFWRLSPASPPPCSSSPRRVPTHRHGGEGAVGSPPRPAGERGDRPSHRLARPSGALLLAPIAVAVTVAGYVAGFALQILALARASAVVAGIAYCFEPVVAALSSVLFLGEKLSATQVLGGCLVLAAILANVVLQHRVSTGAPTRPEPSS